MVLLEVRTESGTTRRCDGVCHRAKRGGPCRCVCDGKFHGVGDEGAAGLSWEELDDARRHLDLSGGETVQLRIGT